MGYYSLGTIPYLVPEVEAVDLSESIASPPAWELTKTTLFLFLPERLDEFEFVQQAYPTGAYEEVLQEGSILYAVYRVEP